MKFLLKNKIYLFVFIFFWSVLAILNNGMDSSEGIFHYDIALQFWKYGQLGFDTAKQGVFTVAPNGKIYASHEIGNTLLLMPVAFINFVIGNILAGKIDAEKIYRIQQFILSFQAGFYTSITLTCFFGILRTHFKKSFRDSFIAACLLCFTTFTLTYSRILFDGVLCSTLITASFWMLGFYREKKQSRYIYFCFILLGLSVITRLSMVIPTFVSIVYLFYLIPGSFYQRFLNCVRPMIVFLPFLAWQLWYNFLRTGMMFKSPVQMPQYYENNALDGNLLIGLGGLLISPGKSIFLYAPLLVFSVIFIRKFWKDYPKETIYLVSISILWLLLHGRLRSWYGASGWGPRHMITILPMMFLPVGVYLEVIFSKTLFRLIANGLIVFGFSLSVSSIISNWHLRLMYASERIVASDPINTSFIWSPFDNQVLDMLGAGYRNIMRLFTSSPIITVKHYSAANLYSSNTVNIWANSLVHAGIPAIPVLLLMISLVIVLSLSLREVIKIANAEIAPLASKN
jgi:hypothetical protein